MRIGCSGQVGNRSGIGVVQHHLYRHLVDAGHELIPTPPRDVGTTPKQKLQGLARGFRAAQGPVDVYLSVVPPLPFGFSAPLLTVVHDLRWMRTRSRIGAAYRAWDLRRTIRRSDVLFCVSENTRADLVDFDMRAIERSSVHWLGPGQVPNGSFKSSESGHLMLVGSAAHKRNELAAEAIAASRPDWVRGIIGVGVSAHVRETLSAVLPSEWHQNISESQMLALYQRAEFFMMLGTNEGFGLPFVEALASGCQVIAIDHTLAREVIGPAGVLLEDGGVSEIASQLVKAPSITKEVRAQHVRKFGWDKFAEACEAELRQLAGLC